MSEIDEVYDLCNQICIEMSYGEVDERALAPAVKLLKFALAELQHDYAAADLAEAAEERGRQTRPPL